MFDYFRNMDMVDGFS